MKLKTLIYGKKFGICAFCGRKIKLCDSVFHEDNICICRECNSKIKIAPFNFLYEGTENLSFVIAPLYYTTVVREAVHKMKFMAVPKVSAALAYYLNSYVSVFEETDEPLENYFDVIVPVPLSDERKKNRGYNQAELIAIKLQEVLKLDINTSLLIKVRNTSPQSNMMFSQKSSNIKDAYLCMENIEGKRILLVDDICTSCNTLDNCAKALKKKGAAMVGAVAVARGFSERNSMLYNQLFS